MSTRTEKVKSLVLTADRNFKAIAVRLLNDVAFPAEKFSAGTLAEARGFLERDPLIGNVIVNGSEQPNESLVSFFTDLVMALTGHNCRVLVYLDEAAQGSLKDELDQTFDTINFKFLAPAKHDFIDTFHVRPGETPRYIQDKKRTQTAESAKPTAKPQNLIFIEASQHIKDTVDMLNRLAQDGSDLATLAAIGQRFNGFFGTFAFAGDRDGYCQLRRLAEIIESISRSYQNNANWTRISDQHLNLLLSAARCAFLTLKDLREEKPLSEELKQKETELTKTFAGLSELEKREHKNQAEVDELLEKLDRTS